MKMLVESLKRMYKKGTLTEEQIAAPAYGYVPPH